MTAEEVRALFDSFADDRLEDTLRMITKIVQERRRQQRRRAKVIPLFLPRAGRSFRDGLDDQMTICRHSLDDEPP